MNGHRPGREERKPKNWLKPGQRKVKERQLAMMAATPTEKDIHVAPLCQNCHVAMQSMGNGWWRCGCGKRTFHRDATES